MRNLMISSQQTHAQQIHTHQIHDGYGIPTWRGACTTGAVSGFGVLGADVRDRQLAVTGETAYATTARKATPGSPAWRPPTS